MTTQHIENRIKWLERQKVDPWDIVGDHDEFNFTTYQIDEHNDRIEKEIEDLQSQLKAKKEES